MVVVSTSHPVCTAPVPALGRRVRPRLVGPSLLGSIVPLVVDTSDLSDQVETRTVTEAHSG